MNPAIWTSPAFQLNDDTCVDVKADEHGVVLGQLGESWLHNLHLTPTHSSAIGHALIEGSAKAIEAGATP
ncbi:hypothetical protein ISP17_11315 [Dyella ginsengisoli]|uniref:Uncharacterized protein n=1 Tax=Dyella ginsengisoli TaxID=363848 RepID=A0ABW8JWC0_9GAMM